MPLESHNADIMVPAVSVYSIECPWCDCMPFPDCQRGITHPSSSLFTLIGLISLVGPSSHAALANQIHRSHWACVWLAGWPVMLLPLFKKQSRLQWQVFQWASRCCCPATRLTLHLAIPHTAFYTTLWSFLCLNPLTSLIVPVLLA